MMRNLYCSLLLALTLPLGTTAAGSTDSVPQNLSAPELGRTDSTVLLLWDRPTDAQGIIAYQIFEEDQLVGETTWLSFIVRNLAPDRTYHFTVRSRRAPASFSAPSQSVTATTKPAGPVINVRELGARGDGVTDDTEAIRKAIAECPPGGTVLLPPGVYLTGHLELKSDLTFQVATGATLLFLGRGKADYPTIPEPLTGPDGELQINNFSLLTARDARNLALIGGGRINGNGPTWWPHRKEGPRPRLLKLVRCSDVLVQDLTLEDPPTWNTHLVYVDRAVFAGVTFLKVSPEHGSNGDGLDPDSTRDMLIVGCRFGNQDDSIAIKSGKVTKHQPRRQRSSENIIIRDCLFDGNLAAGSHPLGIGIGSETSGGARHILIKDCEFRNTASILNLKSNRDRPKAVVEDVRVERCVYTNTEFDDEPWNRAPIAIDLFYYGGGAPPDSAQPLTPETPVFRDVHFRDIIIHNPAGRFAYLCGLVEQPAEDIHFENVTGFARTGLRGQNLDGIVLDNVTVEVAEGEPFTWINVTNRTIPSP